MRKLACSLAVLFLSFCVPVFAQHGAGRGGGGGIGAGGGGGATVSAPSSSGSHASAPAGHSGSVRGSSPALRAGSAHPAPGAAGRSFHVSPARYNAYFGPAHTFCPWHGRPRPGWGWGWGYGGYPSFWYGGFYWGFSVWPYGVWPYFWEWDDPIYIIVDDSGTYYAKDGSHPDQQVPLNPEPKQEMGTVRVIGGTPGDPIFIDKALAGYVGGLKSFQLPVGEHSIEVRGKGPGFGEDILIFSDQELTVNVGQ